MISRLPYKSFFDELVKIADLHPAVMNALKMQRSGAFKSLGDVRGHMQGLARSGSVAGGSSLRSMPVTSVSRIPGAAPIHVPQTTGSSPVLGRGIPDPAPKSRVPVGPAGAGVSAQAHTMAATPAIASQAAQAKTMAAKPMQSTQQATALLRRPRPFAQPSL